MNAKQIESILKNHKTVAVVGLSKDPAKDSHRVAKYLKTRGYHIVPVNPFADVILGEKCYKTLLDVPETVEIVDIFRPAKYVLPIVDQAIELEKRRENPRVIWMQLGIVNEEAARRGRDAGLTVIMDRCMMVEHKLLAGKSTSNN